MATLSLQRTHELTFHVESPILDDITLKSASSATSACSYDMSYWTVSLTRSGQSLSVKVDWYRSSLHAFRHFPDSGTYVYTFMHIVPRDNDEEIATTPITFNNPNGTSSVFGSILATKVLSKDKYRFDIVISTGKDLPHRPIPKKPVSVAPSSVVSSSIASSSSRRDMLLSLLKDVHSVDICFVFTLEKTYPKVGLWAHRAILSRHKVFERLILEATKGLKTTNGLEATETSIPEDSQESDPTKPLTSSSAPPAKEEASDMPSILTIQVDKFSLATMCSILYFIYAGEVQLSIVPNQFAISRPESALVLYNTQGKTRDSVRWDPLSADSDWKLKDVTWPELGLAAEFYGLGELGTLCEKEIAGILNKSNAIDVLFNIGCHSEKVKKQAVDFIAEHMGSLFVGDSNPFEPFRDHPACHDMMVEVFRVKATKMA